MGHPIQWPFADLKVERKKPHPCNDRDRDIESNIAAKEASTLGSGGDQNRGSFSRRSATASSPRRSQSWSSSLSRTRSRWKRKKSGRRRNQSWRKSRSWRIQRKSQSWRNRRRIPS
jgi:hypothetical protein